MSFKSVMQEIGQGLVRILPFVEKAKPVVEGLTAVTIPAILPLEERIFNIVAGVERTSATIATKPTGQEKLAAALPLVVQELKDTRLLNDAEVADAQKFEEAATFFINGTVSMLNAIKRKN